MDDVSVLRRAQRQSIILQCFTAVPTLAFTNGFMLALFNQLGIEGERALRLLGLPSLVSACIFFWRKPAIAQLMLHPVLRFSIPRR